MNDYKSARQAMEAWQQACEEYELSRKTKEARKVLTRASKRLAKLPSDLRCPRCDRFVPDHRKWALRDDGTAECMKCTAVGRVKYSKQGGRYRFDPVALRTRRFELGLSQRDIAMLLEVSQGYYSQLEGGHVKSLDISFGERLKNVLGENILVIA